MPHEVIMPALGMTQDSGLLVAWRKAPGDKVAPGDILMEVETDKTTMEVEAQAAGFLADVRAAEGEDVPVGDVVALITEEKPDIEAAPKPAEKPAAPVAPEAPVPSPSPEKPVPSPSPTPPPALPAADGRILASPKARRLAAEQGLDLGRLAASGQSQPFHVADLDRLTAVPVVPATTGTAHDSIKARVPKAGYEDFLAWTAAETGNPANPLVILSAFAAAALRRTATASDGLLIVAAETPTGGRTLYADPDIGGLSAVAPAESGTPCIVVRDLTASRITAMRFAADTVPVLTVVSVGDGFSLTLHIPAGTLDTTASIDLITQIAARLEEPLRHLL